MWTQRDLDRMREDRIVREYWPVILGLVLLRLAFLGGILWVAWHFISKWW